MHIMHIIVLFHIFTLCQFSLVVRKSNFYYISERGEIDEKSEQKENASVSGKSYSRMRQRNRADGGILGDKVNKEKQVRGNYINAFKKR